MSEQYFLTLPTASHDQVINSGIVRLEEEDQELENICFWKVIYQIVSQNDDFRFQSLSSIVDTLRSYRNLSNNSSSNFIISQRFDESAELELSYLKSCVSTLDSDLELLQSVKSLVLLLPELFPSEQVLLCSKADQQVEFSRIQMASLTACMLIGCIQYPKKQLCGRKFVGFETSLREWTHKATPSSETYLTILANYLKRMHKIWKLSKQNEKYSTFINEKVSVKRIRVDSNKVKQLVEENLETSVKSDLMEILPTRMEKLFSKTQISTVFANKMIGPGSYSTQEELFFGIFPEMLPFSMICKEIEQEECLIVSGVYRQLEDIEDLIFNRHVFLKDSNQIEHSTLEPFGCEHTLLFIDAIPFDTEDLEERSNDCIMREIVKAYCAFSQFQDQTVNSGLWGCGAFGGSKSIKVGIQKIVSGLTKNPAIICTGEEWNNKPEWLQRDGISIGEILNCIKS